LLLSNQSNPPSTAPELNNKPIGTFVMAATMHWAAPNIPHYKSIHSNRFCFSKGVQPTITAPILTGGF
jgi:hypothetical protein